MKKKKPARLPWVPASLSWAPASRHGVPACLGSLPRVPASLPWVPACQPRMPACLWCLPAFGACTRTFVKQNSLLSSFSVRSELTVLHHASALARESATRTPKWKDLGPLRLPSPWTDEPMATCAV